MSPVFSAEMPFAMNQKRWSGRKKKKRGVLKGKRELKGKKN